ncbi:hypothetical protein LBMAG56_37880 [Verrucomicrobiota bacterium]|nr:hypothetical protein LBMAG56_37880 [Verrucomicrobiota bacterium]
MKVIANILLALAILGATNGHWAVLQTVAWTRMLCDFSRTGSLETAITKTFDGQHPCKMCVQIKQGKESENATGHDLPLKQVALKIDFFLAPKDLLLAALVLPPPGQPADMTAPSRTSVPPVPPPRSFVG